jgi:1-deoxy-D-xylulose-5-phosphate reductoisomerase
MNAANEAAVALFLDHKIAYLEIMRRVERVMNRHSPVAPTLPNILQADTWARQAVLNDRPEG